jgi:protein TonB
MVRGLALLAFCLSVAGVYAAPDLQRPRLIYQVRPVYPKLAREARIEGVVRLEIEISKRGAVDRVKLISGHPFLVKAAIDAVRQWRYEPCRDFGMPVSCKTEVAIPFSLRRGEDGGPVVYV